MIARLHFSIDASVLAVLPEFRAAALQVIIPDGWVVPPDLLPVDETDFQLPARHGITAENITTHPLIDGWRQAYRKQGLKSSDWRSSVEALMRRLLKRQTIRGDIPFVNAYNHVCAATLVPMGAYDIQRFEHAHLCLRKIAATDTFAGLSGKQIEADAYPNAFVYAMADEIVCFGINHRDAIRTAVTAATRNMLVVFDSISHAGHAAQNEAVTLLGERLKASGAWHGKPQFFGAGFDSDGEIEIAQ